MTDAITSKLKEMNYKSLGQLAWYSNHWLHACRFWALNMWPVPRMVVWACNANIWETEAGALWILGWFEIRGEILPQNKLKIGLVWGSGMWLRSRASIGLAWIRAWVQFAVPKRKTKNPMAFPNGDMLGLQNIYQIL